MAYDDGHADVMRDAIGIRHGLSERKMFGGLCFMLYGNMVCGVHKDGAMFRVGKPSEPEALKIDGISPLSFTGRPMGGMVEGDEELLGDPARLARLVEMSLSHAATLPAK